MQSIIKKMATMIVACVAMIGLGFGLTQWLKPAQAGLSQANSTANNTTAANAATATTSGFGDGASEANSMSSSEEAQARQQQLQQWLQQHLTDFKKQSGNLEMFLQAWNAQCQAEQQSKTCDALLRSALATHTDQIFANQMLRLLNSLPAYEQAMQSVVMSTATDPRQRYAKIWQLREQMLGQDGALLAFGQEKAFAEYQFKFAELKARAANLSAEQRLAELKQLQQQTLGRYGDQVRQAEGSAGDYEKALQLMLVGVTDPAAQAQITQQLRQQYFSPELAAQMAQRDQQVTEQKQQVDLYQTELAALKQEMAASQNSLPASVWQQQYEQRLTALRLKHFPSS